jgi:hypothetical protein
MKMTFSRRFGATQILFGAALVFALFLAREAKAGDEQEHKHLVTDWSHRRLVFSEPHSLMQRFQLSSNTRYVQQVRRKSAERRGIGRDEWRWYHAPEDPHSLKGDWSMNMGAGATVGAGNYPAKYTFNSTTASCATDFVVYNTSLAGSSSQATIVAFNNIYAVTCGATIPTTYWAYNTGSAGAVTTSPVLSFDGTQVAFIQNAGTSVNLVVLRWKASTGTLAAPATPTAVAAGTCTPAAAPCMQVIPFSTVNSDPALADNKSSPFYDYAQDALYVGDSSGFLHKFTGVFLGTPTEVVSASPSAVAVWPVNLTGGFGLLNSPILVGPPYNEVLVTDNGGLIYAVDATKGGVDNTTANNLDPKLADVGFNDAPLVDVTTGKMYLYAAASSEFITPSDFPFYGTPGVPSVFEVVIPATPGAIHLPGGSGAGYNGYIQSIVADSFTTGTATVASVPLAGDTVTVGPSWSGGPAATVYKFVTALVSANDVLIGASAANAAQNLQAAINANSSQCVSAPCFGTGTAANTGVTAAVATTVVTVTRTTVGGSGVTFTTASAGRVTLTPSTGSLAPPTTSAEYVGTFDDLYYTNNAPANTGFMYACGTHTAAGVTVNSLWVIAVDSGVMDNTTVGLGPSLTTSLASCSPITEFNNGSTNNDRIFLSVSGNAVTAPQIGCITNTGCIMSFDVDSILNSTSVTTARANQSGGTSGIVVDNASASGGASQVYFTPLSDQACPGAGGVGNGTGGCAIQASQSGLN